MNKVTIQTSAAPINAPIIQDGNMTYLTDALDNNGVNKHYLVSVCFETNVMTSKEVDWERVDNLSMCETVNGQIFFSEPLAGKVQMIQPNGVQCTAATFDLELAPLVTETLFRLPALTMVGDTAKLSIATIEDNVVVENIIDENIIVPKDSGFFRTIRETASGHSIFEEINTTTGGVNLGFVKNGRFVRLPVNFKGYLPVQSGLLGYKLSADGAITHLCLLQDAAIDKAIGGDVRDLKRATKSKFNTKSLFGEHGAGVIPHVSITEGSTSAYAGIVGFQGTHVVQDSKIITVAQSMPNGVVVTKDDLVVAIDVIVPKAEAFNPQA